MGADPTSSSVDIESTFPQIEQPERVADTHPHLLHRLRIQVAVPQSHVPYLHYIGDNFTFNKIKRRPIYYGFFCEYINVEQRKITGSAFRPY